MTVMSSLLKGLQARATPLLAKPSSKPPFSSTFSTGPGSSETTVVVLGVKSAALLSGVGDGVLVGRGVFVGLGVGASVGSEMTRVGVGVLALSVGERATAVGGT